MLSEKIQKIRQRRVFIVFSPIRRIAYPARPIAVSYLSIDETRNLGADVGFQYQGHASHDANKALDHAPIEVMAFNSGTILGRPEQSRLACLTRRCSKVWVRSSTTGPARPRRCRVQMRRLRISGPMPLPRNLDMGDGWTFPTYIMV